jgi:glycerol uptake facilitator-like aquaporin
VKSTRGALHKAIHRSAGLFENAILGMKGNTMMRQKAFSLLQLLFEVVISLYIAGIVVPSLLRSDLATNEALDAGSLRTINLAGITLSYTNQNLDHAILGGLVGAMAAIAVAFPATTPQKHNP